MQINGFSKTTLLDYPKHLAATIFLGGCNMRCPFCHNASLVTGVTSQPIIPEQEVLSYLIKRKGILEGVCITGGEPSLYPDLIEFIAKIKVLGLKVKLDTNGTNPKMIKSLVADRLIDYIAMDIKNSKEKYSTTVGLSDFNLEPIIESVNFLLTSTLDYEFRTTIVKEYHTEEDMLSIGKWLFGAKAYFLQSYTDSGDILLPGLHNHPKETLEEYVRLLTPLIPTVAIRGVD
jgi:pyruvate formate lyase activating enzyme